MTRAAAAVLLLIASACVPGNGPSMDPFQDCLGCHGPAGHARTWTVAGTWAKGARVTIVDANGKTVPLRGNEVGNFYTAESLVPPLTVTVDGKIMPASADPQQYGGCNACHHADTITVGPEMAPGSDCLACHGPAGLAVTKFTAAGTFPPANQAVTVGGFSTTTNAVGNFYLSNPITFPAPASVGGSSMEGGAPYGGCGRCHGVGGSGGGN